MIKEDARDKAWRQGRRKGVSLRRCLKTLTGILLCVSMAGCGAGTASDTISDVSNGASNTQANEEVSAPKTKTLKEYTAEYHSDMYPVEGYAQEIEDSIAQVQTLTYDDSVSYIFITDTHLGNAGNSSPEESAEAIYHQLYAAVDVANHSDVDFICVGGDIQDGYCMGETKKQQAIDYIQSVSDILKLSEKPVFIVKGNHDDNSQTGEIDPSILYDPEYVITKDEWYQATMANFPQYATDYHDGYYYYDLPGKNVRVVCLNMVDIDDSVVDGKRIEIGRADYGYKDEQLEWLMNSAFSRPDCEYVILSHDGFKDSSRAYTNREHLQALLKAAYTHTPFSTDKFSMDFTDWTGKIKIYQCGHMHHERVAQYEELGGLPVVTTDSSVALEYEQSPMPWAKDYTREQNRSVGTIREALFDITILNDDVYDFVRFGAGDNRQLIVK